MRRNKKSNIKKTLIAVTALLFILFAVLLIKEKLNNDKLPPQEVQEEENPPNNQNKPEDEEETSTEPEKEPQEEEPKEPEPEQVPEDTEYGIIIQNPEKIDVLVNRKRNLPDTYVPEDLVTLSEVPTVLSNPEVNQLRSAAYEALKELFNAAREEAGYELCARSGYRLSLIHI